MTAVSTSRKDEFLDRLKPGERTVKELPYGGYLFLEHDVPFLMIYRDIPEDKGTIRLARTGASYLIVVKDNFNYFKDFLKELTEKMSARFGSFIILEIFSGESTSTEFVIKGPSHKLPVSLEVLIKELEKVESRKYGGKVLSARIEKSKQRQHKADQALCSIKEIKDCGGTLIGLEVPPVYRNSDGNVYPLYFRKFRKGFAAGIHKAVFEFIRVQTSSDLESFAALGKRKIHEEVFKIDRVLTAIESSYQFLLLVSPVNIQSMRECFFETNFQELQGYHYRLLPLDPDILKRKLYNLRIDEIDDPAIAFLFDEKREEIDQQLTMLKERGSKNFFYRSIRLYQGLDKKIIVEAKMILNNIPEDTFQEKIKTLDAKAFGKLAEDEFNFFRAQASDFSSKIHIREDVNIMMVSKGELYLPADYTLTHAEASALIQHEVGTHALTYYNGSQQPLTQLSQGLADYDSLQEGIAVLSEYLINGLTGNRLRTLAGRVIAGEALLNGASFREVFNLLYSTYGFSKEPAFNITSRIFQGGGFLKDIIYLKGLVELRDYLIEGGDLEFLLAGKFALKHVPMIKDLTDRGLLQSPKIKPRYLDDVGFKERMNKLKQGMSLSQMV
ncbi:flavohemoglobin expression-modulating QEGLA motif protein [Aequorivita sediminis]|uniref:flavohemoglobin expression-modulating QEGLA motif protein n=1 Tax=Aequorivita sediminis TaxID=3073653 RepID=UPI0028B14DA9|nr:tyrosine/phenylalanine carboxypeptidase domain-containing protein [Aequorivita sp. F6058]